MNHKNKIKIILAGTPHFSARIFEKIIQNFEVVGIISQPDRKTGRGMNLTPTPTKLIAKKYNIRVFQPQKIIEVYDEISNIDFDVLLTIAYGQIIPESILNLPKIGSYNIHFSLLPKYRGSSPIQYSLLNGDSHTGITFMEMVKKMDAGDILFQEKLEIELKDNFDSLLEKLTILSEEKILDWLINVQNNQFEKKSQDDSQVTIAPKISKNDEELKVDTISNTINKIRALSSIPGAYLFYNNKRLKIYEATKTEIKDSIKIECSDGFIYATDFQFEGKNRRKII